MKQITLLSLAAATLLFTACGEEKKPAQAPAEKTTQAAAPAKTESSNAVEATKEAAAKAAEATKEAAENAAKAAAEKAAAAKAAAEKKAEEAAAALKERAAAATEAAKEKAADAVEATKETAAKTVDAAKDAVSGMAAAATGAVAAATDAVTGAADNAKGKELFAKCTACHGADGKTKALGKSEVIAGQSAADLEKKIAEYKAGTRNVAGNGVLMKGQVASLSDEDIKAIAAYISSL